MADNTNTEELEVWRLNSAGFHMRVDATEAGRLVRLADVVRWVMVSDELPLMPAVEAVCTTLKSQSPTPELFFARELYLPAPLPADEAFGYFTADGLANIRRVLEGVAERGEACSLRLAAYAPSCMLIDGAPLVTDAATARKAIRYLAEINPVEPGLPAALRYIREHWTADGLFGYLTQRTVTSASVLDDKTLRVAGLSLRFDAVRAIWGWGGAAEDASPVQPQDALSVLAAARKAKKSHGKKAQEWTADEHRWLEEAVRAQGGRKAAGAVAAVAAALDLTSKAVRNQLDASKKAAAASGANVFDWRGGKNAAGQ